MARLKIENIFSSYTIRITLSPPTHPCTPIRSVKTPLRARSGVISLHYYTQKYPQKLNAVRHKERNNSRPSVRARSTGSLFDCMWRVRSNYYSREAFARV